MNRIWLLVLAALLASACILPVAYFNFQTKTDPQSLNLFFGVSFGGSTTSEAKLLIDRVKSYTNLFVIGSWEISGAGNASVLDEICDYAVNAGMSIMVYFSYVLWNYSARVMARFNVSSWADYGIALWHIPWLNSARERWGNKFLGAYLYDEPGGKQIDRGYWTGSMTGARPATFRNVTTYSQAAANYTRSIIRSDSMQHITNTSIPNGVNSRIPVFTSDYALYWFDYLAGYDAIFTQLGENRGTDSKIQQIALCRGAAKVQNKQWGAIITWAYNNPPYMENGTEMLQDMWTAYRAGANYLIIFNYPYNTTNPYGTLTDDHFSAMQKFWNQIQNSPQNTFGEDQGQTAFVLPKDYGWGMRSPNDKIWGLFPADNLSTPIWNSMKTLIQRYGSKLDIIYENPQFDLTHKYQTIYYWNDTIN